MNDMVLSWYSNLQSLVRENFENALKLKEPEHFHKYRTGIKRLRFFRTFLEKSGHERPPLFNSAVIKKIYRLAGDIREIHVEIDRFTADSPPPHPVWEEYVNFLNQLLDLRTRRFIKGCSSVDHSSLLISPEELRGWMSTESFPDFDAVAESFISRKRERITSLFTPPVTHKKIHTIRRHFKQLSYLAELAQPEGQELYHLPFAANEVVAVEQAVGKWHDHITAGYLLGRFAGKHRTEAIDEFGSYRSGLRSIQNSLKKEITGKMIPAWLNQNK
ncbi:MAG: hypothetical protein Kow00127_19070 [Bacteroidales bacterium]